MTLQAIKYTDGNLSIIDQLQLPYVEKYVPIRTAEEGWHAIKEMRVRGAPAIAIVAILALASELQGLVKDQKLSNVAEEVQVFILEKLQYLVSSRPTAVNLGDAARKLEAVVTERAGIDGPTGPDIATAFIQAAERFLEKDLEDNKNIGENGARWIIAHAVDSNNTKAGILTHCNTGYVSPLRDLTCLIICDSSLATSGYGTALGVIRSLATNNTLRHAYCTETRPYNQGSRLTAFELVHDNFPATLITDSMAGALLARKDASVNAVVVGADRVAANGDTANKIGTYGLAVLAKHHGIKFLVAAPLTTIDMATKSGDEIVIEERAPSEVTMIKGPRIESGSEHLSLETISIAAQGIHVWNPAFDITPSALIDGIITEVGVAEKDPNGQFHLSDFFS